MKRTNIRILIITVLLCLLPIALGVSVYDKLPDKMAVHFTTNDIPDNYASKDFAVFGLPLIMTAVQVLCILIMHKTYKNKENEKEPKIMKLFMWYIPIIAMAIYVLMIAHSLKYNVPIGKCVCFVIGVMFILIGNYTPKMNYEIGKEMINPRPKDEKSFRKMTRIMGYTFVVFGLIMLIGMFFV